MKGLNLIMGARNGAKTEREENDFYATHPHATELFINKLKEDGIDIGKNIYEPSAGNGHISEVFKKYGYKVYSVDIVERDYKLDWVQDFLATPITTLVDESIVTNPPFKLAKEFCETAINMVENDKWVCMFVKIQFLEGKARKELFTKYPPKYIYIYSERQHCAMNGDFEHLTAKTQAYCWVMWQKGYKGHTEARWI